jgi:Ca2+-binding RTX toxin-like protein
MTRRYRASKRRRDWKARRGLNVALAVFIVAVVATAVFALTNSILGVNSPSLGQNTSGINPYALEPQLCRDHGVVPTTIITVNGGTAAELILGTNGADTITGGGGNDCIVGGNGNDRLTGGNGTDVCIGGPGTDRFTSCEYCDTTNCTRG